jgi:small subunit ribosomal protein S17
MSRARAPRVTVIGTVVSDKMQKTIAVREERLSKHSTYGKYLRRGTVYKAHDEEGRAKEGDTVEIARTRRLSKTKTWTLVRVIRAGGVKVVTGEADREAAAPPPKKRPEAVRAPDASASDAPAAHAPATGTGGEASS